MKAAITLALPHLIPTLKVLFAAWAVLYLTSEAYRAVSEDVKEHSRFMEVTTEWETKGMYWQFMEECVKRNPLKACEEAQ